MLEGMRCLPHELIHHLLSEDSCGALQRLGGHAVYLELLRPRAPTDAPANIDKHAARSRERRIVKVEGRVMQVQALAVVGEDGREEAGVDGLDVVGIKDVEWSNSSYM